MGNRNKYLVGSVVALGDGSGLRPLWGTIPWEEAQVLERLGSGSAVPPLQSKKEVEVGRTPERGGRGRKDRDW